MHLQAVKSGNLHRVVQVCSKWINRIIADRVNVLGNGSDKKFRRIVEERQQPSELGQVIYCI